MGIFDNIVPKLTTFNGVDTKNRIFLSRKWVGHHHCSTGHFYDFVEFSDILRPIVFANLHLE